jgi:hypothetical protein
MAETISELATKYGQKDETIRRIRITTSDGRRIHRLVRDDRSAGWPQECLIEWAAGSSSVTLAFKRVELDSARVVIPLRP